MSDAEILRAGRALIDAPEKWCKGTPARDATGEPVHHESMFAASFCMFGALAVVEPVFSLRKEAQYALSAAAGFTGLDAPRAIDWQNAPERTHADVLAAFDRAIGAAS